MPVIAQLGISRGKPCAIVITVSEELYKKYKGEMLPIGNPIPAEVFKKFLNDNTVPFEEHESATIIYGIEFFAIAIWKDAEFFAAEDIRNALKPSEKVTYDSFIDYYANHLKLLK